MSRAFFVDDLVGCLIIFMAREMTCVTENESKGDCFISDAEAVRSLCSACPRKVRTSTGRFLSLLYRRQGHYESEPEVRSYGQGQACAIMTAGNCPALIGAKKKRFKLITLQRCI